MSSFSIIFCKKTYSIFVSALLSICCFQQVFAFSDVPTPHPNYQAINFLNQNHVIQGYPDGTFQPNKTVNRAEAVKIILLGSGITVNENLQNNIFPDVENNQWYAKYVLRAKELGIIKGYPDGTFQPSKTVSLVENLKILLSAQKIDLSQSRSVNNPYQDAFSNQWYSDYVQYAKNHNLIDADSQNKVYPEQGMTRGKLAELTYRVWKKQHSTTENANNNYNSNDISTNNNSNNLVTAIDNSLPTFKIDLNQERIAVSSEIYCSNTEEINAKMYRLGGNRWSAYNWSNNASNAGKDWGPNSSDGYLSTSNTPGEAVKSRLSQFFNKNANALITIPILGFVAADKNGNVYEKAGENTSRWSRNMANTDGNQNIAVFQDQFIQWLKQSFEGELNTGKKIFISLDNEPGLWSSTHPLAHPNQVTYQEIRNKTEEFALMVKNNFPETMIFGGVAYGYNEFTTLQNAPDANNRNYLEYFLSEAKKMETTNGKRLVDVLGLHWYPEAKGNGVRIADNHSKNPNEAEVEARLQSVRSLWDNEYIENSWIAQDYLQNKAIRLIPWVKEKIAKNYPGTKLSFSEYNFGGNNDISGSLAQIDTLGVFAKEGVFAACFWPLTAIDNNSYIPGAFQLFLNYDGNGSMVGSFLVKSVNVDKNKYSIYTYTNQNNSKIDVLAINKQKNQQKVNFQITGNTVKKNLRVFEISDANKIPKKVGELSNVTDVFTYTLPQRSALLFEIK